MKIEDVEKRLEGLEFAKPPAWLKARALVAAQNEAIRAHSRRRVKTFAVCAVAACLMLAAAIHVVYRAIYGPPPGATAGGRIEANPITPMPAVPGIGGDLYMDYREGRARIERFQYEEGSTTAAPVAPVAPTPVALAAPVVPVNTASTASSLTPANT